MDNHLHLFVHVPPVPERLWLDPGDEPAAYAFGMRPPECREQCGDDPPEACGGASGRVLGQGDGHQHQLPCSLLTFQGGIAGACVFLCSPAAAYIHGAILPVDGGWLAR